MNIKTVLLSFALMNISVFFAQNFGNTKQQQIDPQEFLNQQLARPKIEFTELERQNIPDTSGYKMKSGKIVYEFTNGPFSGTTELIFDDYGNKQSELETKQFKSAITNQLPAAIKNQLSKAEKNLIIRRNDTVYNYDYNKQQVKIEADTSNKIKKNQITQALLERNIQPLRQETVLGKNATLVNYFDEYLIWFWKGFILKQEKIVGPNNRQTETKMAISIDENYKPKSSDFKKR